MAGNTLTDVQIFNKALMRLGFSVDDFVTAVDGSDTTKFGLIAGVEYVATRDEEFRSHLWGFAVKRAQLIQGFYNAVGTWVSTQLTMTLTGIPIVSFTANSALVSGSDLQSRTLLSVSNPPNQSWIGQTISGVGIQADTIVRGINYLKNSIELSRPVTANGTGVTFYLTPLRVGWLVNNAFTPGNVSPNPPVGIPSGTVITAINTASAVTVTLALSQAATASGSGVSICLQAINLVGYWYIYMRPADAVRDTDIYVLLPDFIYIWPFSVIHQNHFPSITEGGYIYTDLDPNNGNPYCAYIQEVTDYTQWDQMFVDMFVIRLASKMAFYATGGAQLKGVFEGEYLALSVRAQTYDNLEREKTIEGEVWWTDRELI